MASAPTLGCAGRRRSPATVPGYHRGRPPRNKGLQYPAGECPRNCVGMSELESHAFYDKQREVTRASDWS
jgi:hypothetical protein